MPNAAEGYQRPQPFFPSFSKAGGEVVLHCVHATTTAHCDHHLVNVACALREQEG